MSWNTINVLKGLATRENIQINTVKEFNEFVKSSIAKEYLKGLKNG